MVNAGSGYRFGEVTPILEINQSSVISLVHYIDLFILELNKKSLLGYANERNNSRILISYSCLLL